MRRRPFLILESITGPVLIGLGISILNVNLNGDEARLSQFVVTQLWRIYGELFSPPIPQDLPLDALNILQILPRLTQYCVVTFWPMLLVVGGATMLGNAVTPDS